MAGYTRQSTYTDGDVINAADSNDEFDQLLAAFNNATGHAHDGTSAEGPVIGLIGDAGITTPLNKIVVDTGNNRVGVFVDVASSAVEQVRIQDGAVVPVTDDDVDLGASGAEFKDLYIDGVAYVDSLAMPTTTVTDILDEDGLSSNSDTALATQQSIKAYVDAQVTAQDLDLTTDSGTIDIDLDSETLTVAGGTGIDSSATGTTVTLAIDSTVATLTGTQTLTNKTLTTPIISSISNTGTLTLPTSTDTIVGRATTDTLTNKTIDADNNTLSNVEVDNFKASAVVTEAEGISANDNDTTLPTSAAVKDYVDTALTAEDLDITTDSGTIAIDLDSETLTVAGGTGLDSSATGNTVTLAIDSTVATLTGTQTLTNKSIDASQLTGTVANARLDAQLQDVAGLTPADGNFIVGDGTNFVAESGATARTSLGLTIGTDVQAYDAGLASIAGLTTSADQAVYTTASDTYAVTSLTSFGRSLIDDADASAARTTLGLGTAATLNVGTSANNVVQLDGTGKLPAVDGSQLININFTETDPTAIALAIALG